MSLAWHDRQSHHRVDDEVLGGAGFFSLVLGVIGLLSWLTGCVGPWLRSLVNGQ
jgi:hypothetical protein